MHPSQSAYRIRYLLIVHLLATSAIFLPLFYLMGHVKIGSDFSLHADILRQAIEKGRWPAHPLLHMLVFVIMGFDRNPSSEAATLVIAGVAFAGFLAKNYLAGRYMITLADGQDLSWVSVLQGRSNSLVICLLLSAVMSLGIVAPIYSPEIGWRRFYLGKISPNVFHNPTILLAWPFVIMHFLSVIKYLQVAAKKTLALSTVYLCLSTLAKPNYTLAVIPALFVLTALTLFRDKRMAFVIMSNAPMAIGILALQWYFHSSSEGGALVVFAPFHVMSIRSTNVLVTLLTSLAFPIVVTLFLSVRDVNGRELLFAWVALAQASLLAEGNMVWRQMHGNWFWGAHTALFLLFMVCVRILVKESLHKGATWKSAICWIVLGLHCVSGMVWIAKQYCGYGYY